MDAVESTRSAALLARLLSETGAELPHGMAPEDFHCLIEQARREGVEGLLHGRLSMPSLRTTPSVEMFDALARAAQPGIARSLYLESHCRKILLRLSEAGLPVLLLKGSALAYWAYSAPWQRNCSDIDLLLPSRAEVDRAVKILSRFGYRPAVDALPGDLVSFELPLEYAVEGLPRLEVDLHWRLSSTPMFAFRLDWRELEVGAIKLPSLADGARGLGPVHAWLHASMHRLQNRANGVPDNLKWLYDLDLLARGFSSSDWNALVDLACARGLAGACLDGAAAAAARLGETMPDEIRRRLAQAAANERMDVTRLRSWWYVQQMSLAALPSWRTKLRWLRQRLIPDRDHLRARYGQDVGIGRALFTRLMAAMRR